jgi:hypothetical protein
MLHSGFENDWLVTDAEVLLLVCVLGGRRDSKNQAEKQGDFKIGDSWVAQGLRLTSTQFRASTPGCRVSKFPLGFQSHLSCLSHGLGFCHSHEWRFCVLGGKYRCRKGCACEAWVSHGFFRPITSQFIHSADSLLDSFPDDWDTEPDQRWWGQGTGRRHEDQSLLGFNHFFPR